MHHLNCGTMHAYGMPRADDTGSAFKRGQGIVHCLLVDYGEGLALVDLGWGSQDCVAPSPAVRQFADLAGFTRNPAETAIRQVEAFGYSAAAVKHIFLTHLHLDHAGGLPDFPAATVHLCAAELEAAQHPRTLVEWRAYPPEHRAHAPQWQLHPLQGHQWFGLDCAPPIQLGAAEFVLVPFTGHTRGHCGVAVRLGDRWLLHAGDAYGYYRQTALAQPYTHPCGSFMETLVTTGFNMPRRHWLSLRALRQTGGETLQIFCAHDQHEWALHRA